jgi:hypothetical protein
MTSDCRTRARPVPAMAELSRAHPQLNLLNLEAAASAAVLGAEIWLSPPASGILRSPRFGGCPVGNGSVRCSLIHAC